MVNWRQHGDKPHDASVDSFWFCVSITADARAACSSCLCRSMHLVSLTLDDINICHRETLCHLHFAEIVNRTKQIGLRIVLTVRKWIA